MKQKYISKSTISNCIYWLEHCKQFIVDYYPSVYYKYKTFVDKADSYVFKLKLKKHITSKEFEALNNWFCCYANGLNDFDLENILNEEYEELMDFTTAYCFSYGTDIEEETIYMYY